MCVVVPSSYPDKKIPIKNWCFWDFIKEENMITRSIRIDEYTYDKLKAIAKFYHISINELMIELIQIGFLTKEEENINESDN